MPLAYIVVMHCSTAYVLPYPLFFTYAELEVQIAVVVTMTVTVQ